MTLEHTHTHEACSGTPVSWLALEQYQLGELGGEVRREVDAHLQGCEVCRACLELLRADTVALPPLPAVVAPASVKPAVVEQESWLSRLRPAWALAGAGLVAAAAALLLVLLPPDVIGPPGADLPPARIGFKGGELALELVRQRAGAAQHGPTTFAPGDRFKAEVTCAAAGALAADLVVYQGREVDFPLPPAAPLRCGNRVPLPGAFRFTGEAPAIVCLVVEEGSRPPSREALRRTGPGALPEGRAVCVRLTHVR